MQKERLWTPEFLSMGGANLLIFMSQYIMVAALPIFIMDTLGGGDIEAGMAMTCFQIGTVACRPIAGRLIDTVRKQRLMLVATSALLLVMVGFSMLHSLTAIYGLRLVHGIIFALSTTAAATLATLVLPPSRKGEGIGYFALSTNMAMVVGPLIGLVVIGHFGGQVLFLFMVGLALVTLLTANCRHLPREITEPVPRTRHGLHLTDFIETRSLAPALLGGAVFFAYGGILTFIPLYAKSLGLQAETSLFFVIFALVIIITRPVIGRVFDRRGPDWTIYPGFALFAGGMVLFSQIDSLGSLLAAAALLGIGFGALSPAFQTLAVQSAPPARAGVATATYFWSLDISVGLAALLLGLVATSCGYAIMYGIVSTAVIALTAAAYALWRRHGRHGAPQPRPSR